MDPRYLDRKLTELAHERWPAGTPTDHRLVLVDLDYDGAVVSQHHCGLASEHVDPTTLRELVAADLARRVGAAVEPVVSGPTRAALGLPAGLGELRLVDLIEGDYRHGVLYAWENAPDTTTGPSLDDWLHGGGTATRGPVVNHAIELLRRRQEWIRRQFDVVFERVLRPLGEAGSREAARNGEEDKDPRRLVREVVADIPGFFGTTDVYQRIFVVLHAWFSVRRAAFIVLPGIGPWTAPPDDTWYAWQYETGRPYAPGPLRPVATGGLVKTPTSPAATGARPALWALLHGTRAESGRIGTHIPVSVNRDGLTAAERLLQLREGVPSAHRVPQEAQKPFDADADQAWCSFEGSPRLHLRLLAPRATGRLGAFVIQLPALRGLVLLELDDTAPRFPPWRGPEAHIEQSWRTVRFVLHRLMQLVLDQRLSTIQATTEMVRRLDDQERAHLTAPGRRGPVDVRERLGVVHRELQEMLRTFHAHDAPSQELITILNVVQHLPDPSRLDSPSSRPTRYIVSPPIHPAGVAPPERAQELKASWILGGPEYVHGLFTNVVEHRQVRVVHKSDDDDYLNAEEQESSQRYHRSILGVDHFAVVPIEDSETRVFALLSVGMPKPAAKLENLNLRYLYTLYRAARWLAERLIEDRHLLAGRIDLRADTDAQVVKNLEQHRGRSTGTEGGLHFTPPIPAALLLYQADDGVISVIARAGDQATCESWEQFFRQRNIRLEARPAERAAERQGEPWVPAIPMQTLEARDFPAPPERALVRAGSEDAKRALLRSWGLARLVMAENLNNDELRAVWEGWHPGRHSAKRPRLAAGTPMPLRGGAAWLPRADGIDVYQIDPNGARTRSGVRYLALANGPAWSEEPPLSPDAAWVPHAWDLDVLHERLCAAAVASRATENRADRSTTMSETLSELKELRFLDDEKAHILLVGEPGTGKSYLASAAHEQSGRPIAAWYAFNAAARRAEDIQGELFGIVGRSYTGVEARDGVLARFEKQAGTLFIDEIGTLDERAQAIILELLEHGVYRPLGGAESKTARVTVYAATNVAPDKLRPDLVSRFKLVYRVPGLRNRSDVHALLTEYCDKRKATLGATQEALEGWVRRQTWTAHLRELFGFADMAIRVARAGGQGRPTVRIVDLEDARTRLRRWAGLEPKAAPAPRSPPGRATVGADEAPAIASLFAYPFDGRNELIGRYVRRHPTLVSRWDPHRKGKPATEPTPEIAAALEPLLVAWAGTTPKSGDTLRALLESWIPAPAPEGGGTR